MASSLFPDPFQFWRETLTRLENQANGMATDSLRSQEIVRSLHELSSATLSLQQMFDKSVSEYLRRANLPSRKDIAELSQALQRIEAKLDLLQPAEAHGTRDAPRRPARTRRPPASAETAEAKPQPTASSVPPLAKPTHRAPARRKS
jgi:hypothetical protein